MKKSNLSCPHGHSDDAWATKTVSVVIDRPLGSYHPTQRTLYYPVNYGYVEGVLAADGEEQDAYVLGVDVPIERFTGKLIAVIRRRDDVEDKWVVAPPACFLTKEEIKAMTDFQERFFDTEIYML